MPSKLLVTNATIVTGGPSPKIIRNGSITVEDDKIVGVSKASLDSARGFDRVIDAKSKVVCPGFVNTHTHMLQCLLRGWGDDLGLQLWLERVVYPMVDLVTVDVVRAAATLACLEMIKTGVTCVVEHQLIGTSEQMVDAAASVIKASGLRGVIARGVRERTNANKNWKAPDNMFRYSVDEEASLTERSIRKWKLEGNGRVTVCPGPASMASVGDELLTICRNLSTKYKVPVHIHVAESKGMAEVSRQEHGCTEVERLEKLRALNSLTHIVHGVWLIEDDIARMAKRESNLIHCPVSNMYLASGVAPVADSNQKGVNISLGTDGPASNNSHDMFEVMKAAVLLQKVSALNPLALTSYDAFRMAGWNGAKALGHASDFGEIALGKKADVVILDLKRPFSAPIREPISAIVYTGQPSNVDMVIVDGQILMESGRVLTIDEPEAVSRAEGVSEQLWKRANLA